jgi:hypothetical protein
MKKALFIPLSLILAATLVAQDGHRTLTNSDVLNMAKSGIGDKTIILAIQQNPAKFDTSPEALITLKQGGVSDDVLNAMMVATSNVTVASSTDAVGQDGMKLLAKALSSIGTREQLNMVHAIRIKFSRTQTTATGTASFQVDRITVFPDTLYMTSQASNGLENKLVITPETNYQISGKMVTKIFDHLSRTTLFISHSISTSMPVSRRDRSRSRESQLRNL